MKKYNNISAFIKDTDYTDYPQELVKTLLLDLFHIERGFCLSYGNTQDMAYLIIAENETDEIEIESEYRLAMLIPEIEEDIQTEQQTWQRKIYLFGDAGDGIAYYSRKGKDC